MEASTESQPSISKRDLLTVVFRRKWGALSVFIGTVATAIFIVYYAVSPSYESEAMVILDYSYMTFPLTDAPPPSDMQNMATFHTQRDVLESERMAKLAVERTNLAENRVIGRIEQFKILIGDFKRKLGHTFDIEKWKKPWSAEAAAIGAVNDGIETGATLDSKAIRVSYRAKDPDEAARVLAALLNAHIEYYYREIRENAAGVVRFLEAEYAAIGSELAAAEEALLVFKKADRVDLGDIGGNGKSRGFSGITDNTKVQQELKLYILNLEEELRVTENIVDRARRSREQRGLRARIDRYMKLVNSIPDRELELGRLRRTFDTAHNNHQQIEKTLARARIIAAGETEQMNLIKIFEAPQANTNPVFPKKRQIVILAVFMGIMLALTWAFVVDYIDHTMRSAADIKRNSRSRVIGSLPVIR